MKYSIINKDGEIVDSDASSMFRHFMCKNVSAILVESVLDDTHLEDKFDPSENSLADTFTNLCNNVEEQPTSGNRIPITIIYNVEWVDGQAGTQRMAVNYAKTLYYAADVHGFVITNVIIGERKYMKHPATLWIKHIKAALADIMRLNNVTFDTLACYSGNMRHKK
jgi:hypothetical protein